MSADPTSRAEEPNGMTTDKGSRDAAVAADLVPRPERLDLAAVRERLDSAEGPEFWRTLEEVTGR